MTSNHDAPKPLAKWPRVLIITKTRLNDVDSAGASLRNWFRDCPRESLAQLYSGVLAETGFFCSGEYKLERSDRRFGDLFFRIKRSDVGISMQPISAQPSQTNRRPLARLLQGLVAQFGHWFLHTGLWEILFPVRVSPQMQNWLEGFRPQVLYVQGFDISFMRLPLAIHKKYGTPICLHIVDDWPEKLYSGTLLSPIVRRVVRKYFHRLLASSQLRLTIGTLMQAEYVKRYGLPFQTMMQCDEPARFASIGISDSQRPQTLSIVYSGSIALGRWQAILDLARAIQGLQINGVDVEIRVYAPFMDPEMRHSAVALPNLIMAGMLHDRDVVGTFTNADLLFLPESFDEEVRSYTRLSVSTKAHLYMFSRRPILVYGPREIGVVDYAISGGWAYVVAERSETQLRSAVEQLLSDAGLQSMLIDRASEVAARNHDAAVVRHRFGQLLSELAVGHLSQH